MPRPRTLVGVPTPLEQRVQHLENELHLALDRVSQLEASSTRFSDLEVHLPIPVQKTAQAIPQISGKDGDNKDVAISDAAGESKLHASRQSTRLEDAQDEIARLAEDKNGYEIKPNCWEASILIGSSHVGLAGTCFLCFGIMLSVLGEAIVTYVLIFTPGAFINASRPPNEDLKQWRYTEGHNQMNMVASQSLISAVCQGSALLTQATAQSSLVKDMRSYAGEAFSAGAVLATMMIIMWFLVCSQEMRECVSFVSAVLRVKVSSRTDFALTDDSQIVINTISHARLALVLGLSAVRMGIDIALFSAGALWLAAEINIEDLVLNAAALEFVMNFDEMLFYHFAPDAAKVVIEHAAQLPGPSRERTRKCVNAGPTIMLVLGALAVSLYSFLLIVPQIAEIREAKEILCGGDQAFVYIDMDFFPQTATTQASANDVLKLTNMFKVDFLHTYAHRDSNSPETWLDAAQLRQAVAAGALSLYPRECKDHQNLRRVMLRLDAVDFVLFFQAFSGRLDVTSCEELADQCYATNSFWVRFLCPKTCGCDVYRGSLWARTGCPQTCEENEYYWDQQESLPCKDGNKSELQNDPIWISWWVGNWSEWYTAQWPAGFAAELVPSCEILTGRYPAGMIPELLCAHGDASKFDGNLRLFCPETCGCKRSPEGCPSSCALQG